MTCRNFKTIFFVHSSIGLEVDYLFYIYIKTDNSSVYLFDEIELNDSGVFESVGVTAFYIYLYDTHIVQFILRCCSNRTNIILQCDVFIQAESIWLNASRPTL